MMGALSYGAPTGLPLPRFVVIGKTKMNMHVGPGYNFPVSWIYTCQFMPVEVIAEFDTWRQIRDFQGTEGWVHKSLLSGKRTCVVLHQTQMLKEKPDPQSKTVAFLEPQVIGKLDECQGHWCHITVRDNQNLESSSKTYKGWIARQTIWGVYLHETKIKQ